MAPRSESLAHFLIRPNGGSSWNRVVKNSRRRRSAEPKPKRFRLIKLEERIAPKNPPETLRHCGGGGLGGYSIE
jgi:hypothetical protein